MARYAFEEFRLDTSAGEIRRREEKIHLSPKTFHLLVYLVQHPGVLIEKQQLLDGVWPGTHVGDGSLNRAVATLRAALGDDADAPRLIETVPWRGYRFIASVRCIAEDSERFEPRPVLLHREHEHRLRPGDNLIGRDADCDVAIPFASISRHHARIHVGEDRITIVDLESKNGTFVRNRRIDGQVDLQHADEIRLGREVLRFLFAAVSTMTDLPAAY